MRISIWQQFSSNHSSHVMVVGEFQTSEDAQRAGDELHRLLQTVVDWYNAHPDADMGRGTNTQLPLTPPEIAIAQAYGAENPERGIDWLDGKGGIDRTLSIWERFVFIVPQVNTWCHEKPFDRILEKLGAKVLFEADEDTEKVVGLEWLTCIVPDENATPSIIAEVQELLPRGPAPRSRRMTGQGRILRIENCWLRDIHKTLPNLVTHLRERGCIDIQYKLGLILW